MITLDEVLSFYKVKVNELEPAPHVNVIITFSIPYPNSLHASLLYIGFILKTLSLF